MGLQDFHSTYKNFVWCSFETLAFGYQLMLNPSKTIMRYPGSACLFSLSLYVWVCMCVTPIIPMASIKKYFFSTRHASSALTPSLLQDNKVVS